jgi:hypothetical protein
MMISSTVFSLPHKLLHKPLAKLGLLSSSPVEERGKQAGFAE